jgi:L-alanine-DL-glutamate epimerase-like enolase superfamily enzyme
MALYGALAQSQDTTLSDLLNVAQERVRVSFILGTGSLQEVMGEVEWVYESGVRVLKVKVGKNFGREAAQIQQIREIYGDSLELYVDANQCYMLSEAKKCLAELREMGIQWCEEPLPVQYIGKRRLLRGCEIMPLIADDSAFTLPDLEREVSFHTFDVLNIKTARNGFTEAGAMLQMASEAGKGIMVGSQASSLLGCLHAVLFAAQASVEYPTEATFFLKTHDDNASLLPISDGYIDVAQAQRALVELLPMLIS